jgi:hypothetical protein
MIVSCLRDAALAAEAAHAALGVDLLDVDRVDAGSRTSGRRAPAIVRAGVSGDGARRRCHALERGARMLSRAGTGVLARFDH